MMIVTFPRKPRRTSKGVTKEQQLSVNSILRAAYRRYGRGRLTMAAVKHCLG